MKPPKDSWPLRIEQHEFNSIQESIVLLWHYDVLTDSQHDQAITRLEKMYCFVEPKKGSNQGV